MGELIRITQEANNILKIVGLGRESADNDVLVRDVTETITALIDGGRLIGGEIIKVNGPLTIPIAFVLAYKLACLFETVAVYDPKINKYVVVIDNGGKRRVGDLVN